MKRLNAIFAITALALFITSGIVSAQGRGQGRPAGVGAPQAPANSPGRPENPGNKPESPGKSTAKPDDIGKSDSAGPKDAMGFKNYGQYVAASHVAENLHVSLNDLRTAMITNHQSLGDAIKKLQPDLTNQAIDSEVKKAEAEARKAEASRNKKKS